MALVLILKLFRSGSWHPVNLRDEEMVLKKILDLHDIRLGASY